MKITNTMGVAAVLFLAALVNVNPIQAEVLRYRQGGPWQDVSDGVVPGWGLNPANPGVSVPVAGDEARINWAFSTVTLDYEAPEFDNLKIGVDESGVLEINSGGVLTVTGDANVGHNGFVDGIMDINDGGTVNVGNNFFMARVDVISRGFLNVNSGGVMNVEQHLWMGINGTAEVNISGKINQNTGILGLGTINAVDPSGGSAIVNVLSGGELNLNNIHAGGTQSSIQPGSYIDIQGTGRVTLPGNRVEVLEGYRDAGLLYGNGVAGQVDIFTETVSGGAGDFDGDNDIDGQDYLVWQRDPTVGDLANDWLPNYGGGGTEITVVTAAAQNLSAVAGVPEPGSLTILVVSCLAWCGRRRPGR